MHESGCRPVGSAGGGGGPAEDGSGWREALVGKTVDQVMVRHPKSLPVGATVAEVLDAFDDDHVHMVLLVEGTVLRGTVERGDLPPGPRSDGARERPALTLASLGGRTVSPALPALAARELLLSRGSRRSAVVDEEGTLLGLLCLKRRLTGFCSDADVAARATERLGRWPGPG